MYDIKPGSIIKGTLWPEPVEIKLIEEMGNYVHIVGATTLSRNHIDQIIPHEQAVVFYENVGSREKRLLTIPGAGHNDMLLLGLEQYFSAISEFVSAHS